MNRSSLRRQLVLPYVLLVILVSASIGWVSYRAGEDAVALLSRRVLGDMLNRISTATEQHLAGALTVLQAAAPDPATVPKAQPFSDDLASLEARLWIASGLFMEVNNYVYFGGADGRFIGINRVSKDFVELYVREPGARRRQVFAVAAPGERTQALRTDAYDPRSRPWYGIAAGQARPAWSPVYNDFTSLEPTVTLAKPVFRPDRTMAGVVATDVTLKTLTDYLRALEVSERGVAFVIDGDGMMIATSGKELPFKMVDGVPARMHAEEMQSPFIRAAAARVREWMERNREGGTPLSAEFDAPEGIVEVAAASLGRKYGVDWVTVVAIPRSDFMGGVTRSIVHGLFIAAICVVLALVLGLSILNRVLNDIRKLTEAAKRIGEGVPMPGLDIKRKDEIGQLALSFSEMEHNLRIDKLTAVFNRASLIAQIAFLKRQLAQEHGERPTFALLFIDLDNFKTVNDHYGHEAGDKVLVTVAMRLKETVRTTDVVARYGGDEFVVLLKGVTDTGDVIAAEQKIRAVVEQPVPLETGIARVGVSIGWAMFPEDGRDVDKLMKIADSRMFDTKRERKAAR